MSRHRLDEQFLKWPEANVWEWLYLDWAYLQLKNVILLDLVIVNGLKSVQLKSVILLDLVIVNIKHVG